MFVQDTLHHTAMRVPAKTALICAGRRLAYAEIEAMANRLANALIERGVSRGDRVVIYLGNSVEAVVSIYAVLKAGAVFVVVNPTTKVDKLSFIVNNCRATALLGERQHAPLLDRVKDGAPSLKLLVRCGPSSSDAVSGAERLDFDAIQATYPDSRPPQVGIDLDLACLVYTSGSTGEPKGVMCDHSSMLFVSESVIEYLRNVPEDVVLNGLPLSFGYGLYQVFMVFSFGGTLVLERSFAYPAELLKRIQVERVTGFPGVPTVFAMLLQTDLSPYDLSSLRYLTNAAAALSPSQIAGLRQRLPSASLYSMYGLTETKRALYLPPEQLDVRPESVGIAIPGTEVWLEDEAGRRLGSGEVGELVVRGRHVMRGYWDDPEATAERFPPGPLPGERVCHTGDLFRTDDDGYFYFVSRKDDIIKSRGEKVAPKEVENVLYRLPGVVLAAVVGVPDPILGEAVKAFIVRGDQNGRPSEREVLAHCRAHLEDFMVPRQIEFRDELPMTASGKIMKTALRARV